MRVKGLFLFIPMNIRVPIAPRVKKVYLCMRPRELSFAFTLLFITSPVCPISVLCYCILWENPPTLCELGYRTMELALLGDVPLAAFSFSCLCFFLLVWFRDLFV